MRMHIHGNIISYLTQGIIRMEQKCHYFSRYSGNHVYGTVMPSFLTRPKELFACHRYGIVSYEIQGSMCLAHSCHHLS